MLGILIVLTTIFWLAGGARSVFVRSTPIRALAVLPLESVSGDRQQDDFAETMTEQLTARLASLGSWRVASPAAAVRYRGTRKPVAQIAAELGVDAVVEGSVARDGSSVKVAAQLVDARTGRRIWGDAYEQGLDNVLVVQNDLVRAIARETDLRLAPDVSTRLSSTPRKVAPAAYDAYVRGRHAWDKRSESDLHNAIRFFQDSIDADPTYAPAYAGLSDAYAQLGYGSYVSPEDTFPRARTAAEKALALDPSLAEGHASRGYALMYYDWDFAGAESEYRRAIQLNPSYAVAHQWYAYLLTATARPFAAADAEISIAKALDPLSPAITTDRAYISYYYGRNEEALHSIGLALEIRNSRWAISGLDASTRLKGASPTPTRHFTTSGRCAPGPPRWQPSATCTGKRVACRMRRQSSPNLTRWRGTDDTRRHTRLRRSTRGSAIASGCFSIWTPHIASTPTGSSGSYGIRDGTSSAPIRGSRILSERSDCRRDDRGAGPQ
jgi:TolB-like protein